MTDTLEMNRNIHGSMNGMIIELDTNIVVTRAVSSIGNAITIIFHIPIFQWIIWIPANLIHICNSVHKETFDDSAE